MPTNREVFGSLIDHAKSRSYIARAIGIQIENRGTNTFSEISKQQYVHKMYSIYSKFIEALNFL